jgi:hypothetical protein
VQVVRYRSNSPVLLAIAHSILCCLHLPVFSAAANAPSAASRATPTTAPASTAALAPTTAWREIRTIVGCSSARRGRAYSAPYLTPQRGLLSYRWGHRSSPQPAGQCSSPPAVAFMPVDCCCCSDWWQQLWLRAGSAVSGCQPPCPDAT